MIADLGNSQLGGNESTLDGVVAISIPHNRDARLQAFACLLVVGSYLLAQMPKAKMESC